MKLGWGACGDRGGVGGGTTAGGVRVARVTVDVFLYNSPGRPGRGARARSRYLATGRGGIRLVQSDAAEFRIRSHSGVNPNSSSPLFFGE